MIKALDLFGRVLISALFFLNGIFKINNYEGTIGWMESFGLPATADLMFALISTEELEDLNQIVVKQLKNRYNDPTMNKRFVLGIDRAKMRLYDCEQEAQEDLVDSGQDENVFDNTPFAGKSKGYEKFSDLKV